LGPVLAVPEAVPLAIALWMSIVVGELGRPLLLRIYRHRGGLIATAMTAAEENQVSRVRVAHLLGLVPTGLLGLGLVVVGLAAGTFLLRMTPTLHADGRWVALPVLGIGVGQACSLSMKRRAWIWGAAALVLGIAVAMT